MCGGLTGSLENLYIELNEFFTTIQDIHNTLLVLSTPYISYFARKTYFKPILMASLHTLNFPAVLSHTQWSFSVRCLTVKIIKF